jgi:hypothetical protein
LSQGGEGYFGLFSSDKGYFHFLANLTIVDSLDKVINIDYLRSLELNNYVTLL